ncbi:MAG: hypothetical protein JRI37_07190 [Deltaproteobacteria bacterium]|nr:hypothetical protein [Deltaproteobacteria bacterium]
MTLFSKLFKKNTLTAGHKVHIDYYPPRGDAKEAWDVIDFQGMFGLPMSIRLNLQGRDSILAAPLILDLSRWMAVLKSAGRSGLIPELGFRGVEIMGDISLELYPYVDTPESAGRESLYYLRPIFHQAGLNILD